MKRHETLTRYAGILRRVTAYAKWEWWRTKNEDMELQERLHGESKDTEDWKSVTQPPEPSADDMKEIGLPLALSMSEGGDPFPSEWEELRGALAIENLPEIRDETMRLHDSFVALFPTGATKYGWQAIEEKAGAFAAFLDGLPPAGKMRVKKERKRYPQDNEALEILKEAARRKGTETYANCSSQDVIRQMMAEQAHREARILRGKLHGKKGGREQVKAKDRETAIKTWGKYLSAYILDHPPKAGKK